MFVLVLRLRLVRLTGGTSESESEDVEFDSDSLELVDSSSFGLLASGSLAISDLFSSSSLHITSAYSRLKAKSLRD